MQEMILVLNLKEKCIAQVGQIFQFVEIILFFGKHTQGLSSSIQQDIRILIDTPWLVMVAGKMILAQVQWIWPTKKFDQLENSTNMDISKKKRWFG